MPDLTTFSGPSPGSALPREVLADAPKIATELDLDVATFSNSGVTTSNVGKADFGGSGLCTSDVRRSCGVRILSRAVAVVLGLLSVAGWTVTEKDQRFVGGLALVVSTEAGSGRVR